MNSYRNLLIERVCVAKILCALKIARFPAVRAVPSKLFLHPRAPRFSPGGTQRGIPIYKDGGTRTFSRRYLVRIRQPDRTGGAGLPVAHAKGRDLSLSYAFFRLFFPSRVCV